MKYPTTARTARWQLLLTALVLTLAFALTACTDDGEDEDEDDAQGQEIPSGDTDLSSSDLEGNWAGTIEPRESGAGKFRQLYFEFDSEGEITRVDLDGSTLDGVSGTLEGKPTDSDQIFEYTVDGDTLFLWFDADASHAGVVFDDATVGVLEKDAGSNPGYDNEDAVGSWSGAAVYLVRDPDLAGDGFDDVSGTYEVEGSDVVSTDLTFTATGDAEDCVDVEHSLSGFDASYGVYDTATATGGEGDCPGSEEIAADAYITPDASFMLIFAGCEAGDDGSGSDEFNGCSVATLNKQ